MKKNCNLLGNKQNSGYSSFTFCLNVFNEIKKNMFIQHGTRIYQLVYIVFIHKIMEMILMK